MDLIELGSLLKRRREELDLTQREIADMVGITVSYLAMLESAKNPKTGKPSKPSFNVLQRLMHALNLDDMKLMELAGYSLYSPIRPEDMASLKTEMESEKLLRTSESAKAISEVYLNPNIPIHRKREIDTQVSVFIRWQLEKADSEITEDKYKTKQSNVKKQADNAARKKKR